MVDTQSLVPTDRRVRRRARKKPWIPQVNGLVIVLALPALWFGGTIGAAIGWPLLLLAFASSMVLARRQVRRFVIENQEALDAMNRGDLATALDIWDFWSEIPNHKRIMVISCHALAWIWMLQGRLEEAKKLQIENNTFELKALQRVGLAKTGAADLALIHALLGELDDATRWLATAEQRNKPPQTPNGPPMVILTRAVIALRRGEIDSALQVLDEGWTLCESRFPISTMRTLRAIRAFGRIASGPRNAGTAYEDIAAIRPRFPGEHQFLATAWPDMAAFLATNGLA